ncbi:MAG: amidophosphoribosyltransferase [Candidatus Omnitrophica bacterium]|nr:amidophosphoribosyltransferase [Candidatus Omnitrophota bacterium]
MNSEILHFDDHPREECGVFGIYGHPRAAEITYLGLFALQHRGEESAGIVTSDGEDLKIVRGLGLVSDAFTQENLAGLKGNSAIGHVRYSTTGSTLLKNAQPQLVEYSRGQLAVAHNGNITNARRLRDELEAYGSIFQSTVDSEIIIHLMAKPTYRNREESLAGSLNRLEGAFTLVMLTESEMIGVRDPHGFRPLILGKLDGGWVLASETCALDLIGAQFEREINSGEVVMIDQKGLRSIYPFSEKPLTLAHCIFEHVYFARPDSDIFGQNVGQVRERLGMELAREHPAKADIVIAVPDSGNFAALGYARQSGIPMASGIMRNHYIGRTFINPSQSSREFNVRIKLNPIRAVLQGKRVIVVDDSIVRGNTARYRVKSIREAGAKEVHLRISCPPIRYPCYFGIDFPDPGELIANSKSVEEIEKFLTVDSLGYISKEGFIRAVTQGKKNDYCTACFFGNYPVEVEERLDKFFMERKKRL